ncbi:DNA adenine methylase [Methylobacterium sp. BTF04]|uniref:DNA adenine methylase n=1 Tax=Methylobacterium sp. BTF04 TaxID=2708300 RepID=UPI0013CF73AD|nr:DNA adenine methylase [Methylobacterium sp. BTF04]NEU14085.1 DNA adenine methylase [Methylobacterium sp. BTF04]
MEQFTSPLRYPGGKGRLTQFVADLIDENGLSGCEYVEPYAGGAGIAITLLYLEYASHIHLNDINKSVYAFWDAVLRNPEDLCRLIRDTPLSMDEWYRQRSLQFDSAANSIELGFSTFFLNRTNRSGIIKGGVIGGKSQLGDWKLDARYNAKELIARVQKIASYSSRISLYNLDAAVLIRNVLPSLPKETLVYLDPPYYIKGKGLYEDHYSHDDHASIANIVQKELRLPWIVSYDNVEPIRNFYANKRQTTFGIWYTAGKKHAGKEVMVYSDELKIPAVIEPSRGIAA